MKTRLLPLILAFVIMSQGCKEKAPVFTGITGLAQGSSYNIVFDNSKNYVIKEIKNDVDTILKEFDRSLSIYNKSSLISRINRNEDVKTDKYFNEIFKLSGYVSKLTDGAFDITVGPLVKAWGFGPDGHKSFSEQKRDSLLRLVGMDKIFLKKGKLVKSDPGIFIDVNAIAQGYAVDIICKYFDKRGVKNYLIEIGGEVRAKGTKGGAFWKIGIDKPEDGNDTPGKTLEAIIKISNKALATSGNYRKYYIEDGRKYSHEIDPKTGYPVKNSLLSISLIADECAIADAVATACMVMGKEKTISFLNEHPEFEAYLIYSDDTGSFKTWSSARLSEYISETDK